MSSLMRREFLAIISKNNFLILSSQFIVFKMTGREINIGEWISDFMSDHTCNTTRTGKSFQAS